MALGSIHTSFLTQKVHLKSDSDAFAALKLEVKWQQPEH